MAVVVILPIGAREFDVEPSDISEKDGVLTVHKDNGSLLGLGLVGRRWRVARYSVLLVRKHEP